MACGSDRRGSASDDLCAACEGRVILAIVAVDTLLLLAYSGPLPAFTEGSFCNGSFSRFAAAAAPRLEMEMAWDNDP